MDPLSIIGGVGSLLGGLFGGGDNEQKTDMTTTSHSEATAQDLADPLLQQLKELFTSVVGSGQFTQAGNAVAGRLGQLTDQSKQPQFDVNAFAKGITDQATANAGLDLESSINGLLSKSGTTESGNSMNALLANKLRNQTAANLAGISQQATATGEGIRESQQGQITQGIQSLGSTLASQILALIQQTRGAENKGVSDTKTHQVGTGTASQSMNPLGAIGDMFSFLGKARSAA